MFVAPLNKDEADDPAALLVAPNMLLVGGFEISGEGCPKILDVFPAVLVLGKDQPGWDFAGSVIASIAVALLS